VLVGEGKETCLSPFKMSEISDANRRSVMEKYGVSVYAIRLAIASDLYAYGVEWSPCKCLTMADAFVEALVADPPIY
jgi:hypothetical protein